MDTEIEAILGMLHALRVGVSSTYEGWGASINLRQSLVGMGRDEQSAKTMLQPLRTEQARRADIDRLRHTLGQSPLEGCLIQEEGDYSYKYDPSLLGGVYPHVVQFGGLPQLTFAERTEINGSEIEGLFLARFAAGTLNCAGEADRIRHALMEEVKQKRERAD